MKHVFTAAALVTLIAVCTVPSAQAARIDFVGPLVAVDEDDGSGRYAGRNVGDHFAGHIDDQTAVGAISDGTTVTTFGRGISAGSFTITNDVLLDFAAAGFLNQVSESDTFSFGSVIDLVDIEGDTHVGDGLRIEVGLTFILPPTTFASDTPLRQSFDADSALVTLFYVTEDDSRGIGDIYSATGRVTAVPLPASIWLVGLGLSIVASFTRHQQKRR